MQLEDALYINALNTIFDFGLLHDVFDQGLLGDFPDTSLLVSLELTVL